MIKKLLFAAVATVAGVLGVSAQIITTTPSPLQLNSQDITIYYHADQGSGGLKGLAPTEKVYAHTGVILSTAKSDSDWSYATPSWSENLPKYEMTYVSPNLYKLEMKSIYDYYGITDASAEVKKLAFVFRSSDGKKEGKTATGGDIFVDVMEAGFQLILTTSLNGGTILNSTNNNVHFELGATEAANLSISVNGSQIGSASNTTLLKADYTFSTEGNYKVVGTAVKDGETYTTEVMLVYPKQSPQANYPGGVPKMGPVRNADGSVTFCLAAPQKTTVMLVGSWNDMNANNDYVMNYQDYEGNRYFWTTVPDLDPDTKYMYYFAVDGQYYVADPYAKLILDPSYDKYIPEEFMAGLPKYPTDKIPASNVPLAIYHENINNFNWTDDNFVIPNKTDLIIYELLFRDFTGTEGKADANGTVKQALAKLPYLKQLGVNVIELLPICEFNGNISWGYNPNFYFAPDKAYGTPDDYKEFINECHNNGIAVVLDMVFNQTDWLHPWYQMYPAGRSPMYNATAPHAYSVLNDWNQGHPLVRQQWEDVVKYWINEYHFDGYRFDLVKGLGDNDSYANATDGATNAYNKSRVENMRRIQLWMEEANPDALVINENLAGSQEENQMAAYGQLNWFNMNYAACEFAMGWPANANMNNLLATNSGRTAGSTISYLESHDEERLAYKQDQYGATGIKGNLSVSMNRLSCAAAMMIMCPGSHMIWQFSELGNNQSTKGATDNDTDPKKVLWSYYDVPDRQGLYWNYAELIKLRKLNPDLFSSQASTTLNYSNWDTGRFFTSTLGGKELYMIVNPKITGELVYSVSFGSTNQDDYMIYSKSYGSSPKFDVAAGTITVPPNCYVVVINSGVNNAVQDIASDVTLSEPVAEQWFTLTGAPVANPDKGIYVKVVKYADGSSRAYKVVK